jgi:hypothetical protein
LYLLWQIKSDLGGGIIDTGMEWYFDDAILGYGLCSKFVSVVCGYMVGEVIQKLFCDLKIGVE